MPTQRREAELPLGLRINGSQDRCSDVLCSLAIPSVVPKMWVVTVLVVVGLSAVAGLDGVSASGFRYYHPQSFRHTGPITPHYRSTQSDYLDPPDRSGSSDEHNHRSVLCVGSLCVDKIVAAAVVGIPFLLQMFFYAASSSSSSSSSYSIGYHGTIADNVTLFVNNTVGVDNTAGDMIQQMMQEHMQQQQQEENQSNILVGNAIPSITVLSDENNIQSQFKRTRDTVQV